MKISVIVPVYNVLPYIKEFLDSLTSQTFKDFEAVLVDDGSTDGTGNVLAGKESAERSYHLFHGLPVLHRIYSEGSKKGFYGFHYGIRFSLQVRS